MSSPNGKRQPTSQLREEIGTKRDIWHHFNRLLRCSLINFTPNLRQFTHVIETGELVEWVSAVGMLLLVEDLGSKLQSISYQMSRSFQQSSLCVSGCEIGIRRHFIAISFGRLQDVIGFGQK